MVLFVVIALLLLVTLCYVIDVQ